MNFYKVIVMIGKYNFYLWLIEALKRRKMTLPEIRNKWYASSKNLDQTDLTDRTFHRYRENIASELGVIIECNKKAGNIYYIKKSIYDDSRMLDWLLSAFKISMLGKRIHQYDVIMLEDAPQDIRYLDDILNAIEDKVYIQVDYQSVYGQKSSYIIAPFFVRLFKQRWYIIGEEKQYSKMRILAIERILSFEVLTEKFIKKDIISPRSFFKDCYGITKLEGNEVITIGLRAFWPQYVFLEERPLHHSQKMIKSSYDGEYREYEIKVQPTFDLKQELLNNGRGLVVLYPDSFKKEMIATLEDMVKGYSTGKDYSGEGLGHDALPINDLGLQ